MKAPRIDIGKIRRDQIVEAAVSVIAEQGIQNLSLSEIETKVGMSRGQLTYYFKAKEDILLAVFDRLVLLLRRQHGGEPGMKPEDHPFFQMPWLDLLAWLMRNLTEQPPRNPEFNALIFTFMAQLNHRSDFRDRLAKLFEEWRGSGCTHLARDLKQRPSQRKVSPRAMATLTQAILHGLVMQSAVDPDAFDQEEVMNLCLDMIRSYLWPENPSPARTVKKTAIRANKRIGSARNRAARNGAARNGVALRNGVKHERS